MGMTALRPKSGLARGLWLSVWGPLSLLSAFVPLMILNPLQFPSLLLLPVSKRAFRAYNRTIAYLIWGWWAWSMEHLIGLDVAVTGDAVPDREDAIVFANHQGMGDILVLLCLAMRKHRVGDAKWLVKDVVKYVPGVGWGMLFLGCIFLKRNWADDEATIRRTFKSYVDGRLPVWLVSFPEGTRITPGKLASSQGYATQAGLKPTQRVMLPRPKGFAASVQGLRGHVKAVYSVTIYYADGWVPTLVQLIRGETDEVRVHVQRYPIETLPRDEPALAAWLTARFYEKEAWLSAQRPRPSTAASGALSQSV